jgi:hypothetical protein
MQSPAFWPGFFLPKRPQTARRRPLEKISPMAGELPPRFVKRTRID